MTDDSDDRSLLAAALSGDRAALERLLLRHGRRLKSHLARRVSQDPNRHALVEDLFQQTCEQAIRDIEANKFADRADGSFVAWLLSIADSQYGIGIRRKLAVKRGGKHRRVLRARDSQRSTLVELVNVLSDGHRSPSSQAALAEAVEAVQQALGDLPADQQAAIRLRYLEQHSLAQVAATMHRSPDAVRGLLHRAKGTLREKMGSTSNWIRIK